VRFSYPSFGRVCDDGRMITGNALHTARAVTLSNG